MCEMIKNIRKKDQITNVLKIKESRDEKVKRKVKVFRGRITVQQLDKMCWRNE